MSDPMQTVRYALRRAQAAFSVARFAEDEETMRQALAALDRIEADVMRRELVFAGWFRELPSGMSYRLWEQGGHESQPGYVALYEDRQQ